MLKRQVPFTFSSGGFIFCDVQTILRFEFSPFTYLNLERMIVLKNINFSVFHNCVCSRDALKREAPVREIKSTCNFNTMRNVLIGQTSKLTRYSFFTLTTTPWQKFSALHIFEKSTPYFWKIYPKWRFPAPPFKKSYYSHIVKVYYPLPKCAVLETSLPLLSFVKWFSVLLKATIKPMNIKVLYELM